MNQNWQLIFFIESTEEFPILIAQNPLNWPKCRKKENARVLCFKNYEICRFLAKLGQNQLWQHFPKSAAPNPSNCLKMYQKIARVLCFKDHEHCQFLPNCSVQNRCFWGGESTEEKVDWRIMFHNRLIQIHCNVPQQKKREFCASKTMNTAYIFPKL